MKLMLKKGLAIALCLVLLEGLLDVDAFAKNEAVKSVMIKYKSGFSASESSMESKKAGKKIKKFKKTKNKDVYIADVDISSYNDLFKDPNIELVEEDSTIQAFELGTEESEPTEELQPLIVEGSENIPELLETGGGSTYNPLGDKVGWNISRTKSDKLHDMGITGNNVKVAVFDTGIDLNNPDLNVAGGVSFVDGVTGYEDDNGHGTAMAGILAAKLNGSGLVGIAPNIELYSVKVLDKDGNGLYSNVLQGVDWAIENNIKIITMSFGGSQYSQILAEAIKRASDNNIIVVAASGNSGEGTIYYPAAFQPVICVGATDSQNMLSPFSNTGEQMDLVAPGQVVETYGLDKSIIQVEGTSASVQHVAGIAALLWGVNNSLTNGQIKFLLYYGAYVLGPLAQYGYGMPDAIKAYENALIGDYRISVVDQDGEEFYIDGSVDVGGDGIFTAQTGCPCTGCSASSTYYYLYSTHTASGHQRVNQCAKDACRSIHAYTCVYLTTSYQSLTTCCQCGYHNWPTSTTSYEAAHTDGSGHKYYKTCTKGCGATQYTGTYNTNVSGCCKCGNHVWGTTTYNETAHPHMQYKKCTNTGCPATSYTGSGGATWSGQYYESHPHKGYKICQYSGCGFIWYNTQLSWSFIGPCYYPAHPHEGYKMCSLSGCSYIESTGTNGPCYCHTCSFSTKVYGTHTSTGDKVYMQCSCGESRDQNLTERNPNCLSCTTPPTAQFVNISASTLLGETDTNFKPQINVQDNENDTLTCKYYIDETLIGTENVTGTSVIKLVTFNTGFSTSTLNDGVHTIKVDVYDSIAPTKTISSTFTVDKSLPIISNVSASASVNGVNFAVSASDAVGLDASPYQYTVPGIISSSWLSASTYPVSSLGANTNYTYQIQVRDKKGHIEVYNGSFCTKASTPDVNVQATSYDSLVVSFTDSNPQDTEYMVSVGPQYVNATGNLVQDPAWITFPAKSLTITGLSPETQYNVLMKARNRIGEPTATDSASGTTWPLPPIPPVLTADNITQTSATLTWSPVFGASTYSIKRLNVTTQEIVQYDNVSSPFVNSDLEAATQYQYRIKSENPYYISEWSDPPTPVTTLPYPPARVTGVTVEILNGSVTFSWPEVAGADYYKIKLNDIPQDNTYEREFKVSYTQYDYKYYLSVLAHNDGGDSPDWSESCIKYSPANIPSNVTAENIRTNSVTIIWQPNGNPETVKYQIGVFDISDTFIKQTVYSGNTQDSITGLAANSEYIIKVRAMNSENTDTSWTEGMRLHTLLPAPENLRSVGKDTQICLAWDAVSDAVSYTVKRNGIKIADNLTNTSFTDAELTPQTTYVYSVCAVNELGEGAWSIDHTKTTLQTPPAAPQNVIAIQQNTAVSITWDAVINATGYELLVDGKIVNAGVEPIFVDNGLIPGSWHTYRVRSRNSGGKSEWTSLTSIRTAAGIPELPDGVAGRSTDSKITITWMPVINADFYEVEVNEKIYGNIRGSVFTLNNLPQQTEYSYRIRAVNVGGNGEWTLLNTIITQATPIDAPVLSATTGTDFISLSWSPVDGSSGYELEIDGESMALVSFDNAPLEYTDDGLGKGEEHIYRVRALYSVGMPGQWCLSANVFTLPDVPSLNASSPDSSIISLEWEAVTGATNYQLEADGLLVYDGSAEKFIHTRLEPGSSHTYRIRAGNSSGYGNWSTITNAVTRTNMDRTPQNPAVSFLSPVKAGISWDAVAGAIAYKFSINGVETAADYEGNMAYISTIPGNNYSVRIMAKTMYGTWDNWSDEISFTTPYDIPAIPIWGNCETTDTSAVLRWNTDIGVSYYELKIDGGNTINIGNVNAYEHFGLQSGSQHNYEIRACNGTGKSGWSILLNLATESGIQGIPAQVSVIYATGPECENGAISIRWDAVENAEHYEIETNNNGTMTTVLSSVTSASITGLNNGTLYAIHIRAVNPEGNPGPWSPYVGCMVTFPETQITTVANIENRMEISWNPVPGAITYDVEMDGVIVGESDTNSSVINAGSPYIKHIFRVRAKNSSVLGFWSQPWVTEEYGRVMTFNVVADEEFSLLIPALNLENAGNYGFYLEIPLNQAELVDACEFTPKAELNSTIIAETGTELHISYNKEGCLCIEMYENSQTPTGVSWSGVVNSIKLRSKITGTINATFYIHPINITGGQSNNSLSALSVSTNKVASYRLYPDPASGTYSTTVLYDDAEITINATAENLNSFVKIGDASDAKGYASSTIDLIPGGDTTIPITVTSLNGNSQVYTVFVKRIHEFHLSGLLLQSSSTNIKFDPLFNIYTLDYVARVGSDISNITVTPSVLDSTSTIEVNGVSVLNGQPSQSIELNYGVTKIDITVTTVDGNYSCTYTVSVVRERNVYLSALMVKSGRTTLTLDPEFSNTDYDYVASCPLTPSVAITATAEAPDDVSIKVNGNPATSGSPIAVPVTSGTNEVVIIITSNTDGSSKTYTCNVSVGG